MQSNFLRPLFIAGALSGLGLFGLAVASQDRGEDVTVFALQGTRPLVRPSQIPLKSIEELTAILGTHPGGKEALAAAAKGGARLTVPKSGAVSGPPVVKPPFAVTLKPGQLELDGHTASFEAVMVNTKTEIVLNVPVGVPNTIASRMTLKFKFPSKGWYLINVDAILPESGPVAAEITTWMAPAPLQTWSYQGKSTGEPVTKPFPFIFEFKGEDPSFRFYLTKGILKFVGASVQAL